MSWKKSDVTVEKQNQNVKRTFCSRSFLVLAWLERELVLGDGQDEMCTRGCCADPCADAWLLNWTSSSPNCWLSWTSNEDVCMQQEYSFWWYWLASIKHLKSDVTPCKGPWAINHGVKKGADDELDQLYGWCCKCMPENVCPCWNWFWTWMSARKGEYYVGVEQNTWNEKLKFKRKADSLLNLVARQMCNYLPWLRSACRILPSCPWIPDVRYAWVPS